VCWALVGDSIASSCLFESEGACDGEWFEAKKDTPTLMEFTCSAGASIIE